MWNQMRGLTGLSLLALVMALPASAAATETDDPNTLGGRAQVYGSLQPSSLSDVENAGSWTE